MPLHALDAVLVHDAQILDLENAGVGRGGLLVDAEQDLAAHHQFGQRLGRGVLRFHRGRHLAPSHDADGVGDLHDLAQLVGDQDDRLALVLEAIEDAEQVIGLGRGQHAGGFVEDQDIGLAVKRLQDLDALLVADGQFLDRLVRIDVQLVFGGEFGQELARLGQRWLEKRAFLGAEDDILEYGEVLDQLEVLEDHADAGGDGGLAVGDLGLASLDEDLARVGLVEAVEDRHEGRLARAVLADDAVDRARHDADGNVLVGLDRAEGLGNAFQFNGRGGRVRPPRIFRAIAHQKSIAGQLSSDM